MSDHPRSARGARGLPIAAATALGLLLLLLAVGRTGPRRAAQTAGPTGSAGAAAPLAVQVLDRKAAAAERREEAAPAKSEASLARPARRRGPVAPEGLRERDFYALRRAEADRDLPAFETAAPSILLGDGPLPDKVAVLRALEDAGSRDTVELMRRVVREAPVTSTARSVSLPAYAVRRLTERAPGDREAREALRAAAFGPGEARDLALRLRAADALARAATDSELLATAPDLAREEEQLVRQAFHVGLEARGDVGEEVLAALGRPDEPFHRSTERDRP